MSHPLFEAGEILLGKIELGDEHVQVPALIAHVHADPGSVVDYDEGEYHGKGESARVDALIVADGGNERHHEAGMGAWHVAVGKGVFPGQAVLPRVNDKLERLSEDAHQNWN